MWNVIFFSIAKFPISNDEVSNKSTKAVEVWKMFEECQKDLEN